MIELRFFGTVSLKGTEQGELSGLVAQPKRLALLAYLALARPRGFHRRDRLLGLFWSELDQERARGALRKAVHVLRRELGDDVVLARGDEELGLDWSAIWCDAVAFEEAIAAGRLAAALELYRGELLQSFFIPEAGEFDHWLEQERARYRSQAATASWVLAQRYEADSQGTLAAEWARRTVTLAPLDERIVRKTIAMLDRLGDRAGAVALYESFRRRLLADFDVEPAPETKELIQAVRSRQSGSTSAR